MKKKKINNTRIIFSIAVAVGVTAVFIALATIVAELFHPFKDWLKATFYHHWIGKGVLSIAIFTIVSFLVYPITENTKEKDIGSHVMQLFWIVVLSMSAVFLFYLYELFAHA